ncbi:MAG TPA: N-acetyltransferase [Allosphingosinicella sp.]|jgi:putative acetyltransferase|nr:N-acetyltransferase [Allosphingosinicella sp.]
MSLLVRPEAGGDVEAIRNVHLAAFLDSAEADLVDRLRGDFDSEISLVAEQGGEIVGHVMLSRMSVSGGGQVFRALGLGPVGVLPGSQGSGVGSALIRSALGIAGTLGEEVVFVLGEPDYYSRFGFSAEAAAPFASPYSGPFFMALWLHPPAEPPAAGSAAYAPAFGALGQAR